MHRYRYRRLVTTPPLRCPHCDRSEEESRVIDSRHTVGTIRRTRKCACGENYPTVEITAAELNRLHDIERQLQDAAAVLNAALEKVKPNDARPGATEAGENDS